MTLRRQDSQDKPGDWEPKPGDRVVRHPRQEEIGPVVVNEPVRRVPARALASPMLIIYAFVGLIAVGTLLLMLPFTQHSGEFTPFREALFTATSAVTVTGLVIKDTAVYWTRTGQTIILGLIFVGGLGFMTIGTFLLILIGQRVTLTQRLLVRESLGVNQLGGLVQLTIAIVLVAVAIQTVGFFVLLAKFLGIYPTAEAVWQAAFHAVSGFNNAGFIALTEKDGLGRFQADWVVLGTIGTLIVLGAISYWVLFDVVRYRRFSLFTLTTKLVLVFTGVLILLGTVVFFAFEYGNPDTIGPMSLGDKVVTSVFESVSGRTAGFTAVGFGNTEQQTNFFFTSLMFIGGASGSVAGGIKVNTFAIVLICGFLDHQGPQTHLGVRQGDTADPSAEGTGHRGGIDSVRLPDRAPAHIRRGRRRFHRSPVRERFGLRYSGAQHGRYSRPVLLGPPDPGCRHVCRQAGAAYRRPRHGEAQRARPLPIRPGTGYNRLKSATRGLRYCECA